MPAVMLDKGTDRPPFRKRGCGENSGRGSMMKKSIVLLCALGAGALIAADALAGANLNSSRSNRGKICNCPHPEPIDVSIVRQPSGYRRAAQTSSGELVFRKVPKGSYALAVRASDARGASIDMIENDVGDIACDWTDRVTAVECRLTIDRADRPDVTVKIYSFGEEEEPAAAITESSSSSSTSGEDKPRR